MKLDRIEFLKELTKVAKAFEKKLDPERAQYYYMACYHYPLPKIIRAFDIIGETFTKFPKPAEVKEFLKTLNKDSPQERIVNEEKEKLLKELEDEFTLISKQICANGINVNSLMKNPAMRRLMQVNGKAAQELNRDYITYKTSFTNIELLDKQRKVSMKISDLMRT